MATTTVTVNWPNGLRYLRKGTPLSSGGSIVNDNSAVGILTHDMHYPETTATLMTSGTWHEDESNPHSGIYISDAVKAQLSGITFDHPYVEMAKKSELPGNATATVAGLVKQAASVADCAGAAPTKAEFEGLRDKLVTAGVIAAAAAE